MTVNRQAGAVVPAASVLALLISAVDRYRDGTGSALELDGIAYRVSRQLGRACWCDEDVCCEIHKAHTSPHRRCILR